MSDSIARERWATVPGFLEHPRLYTGKGLTGDLLLGMIVSVNFCVSEGKRDIQDMSWRPGKGRKQARRCPGTFY